MGRAVDLFVTYRFLKLLTTPFEKTDAFKLGIIDKDGHRIKLPKSTKPAVELTTSELKNSYTILHKLIFNIKKLFQPIPVCPVTQLVALDIAFVIINSGSAFKP